VSFAGRTDTSLVRQILLANGLEPTPDHFQRFFDTYVFWLDALLGELEGGACPGVNRFLKQLHSLPRPPLLGLLTGNVRLGAELKLRHYQLWHPFRTGAFGNDHEDRNRLAVVAHHRAAAMLPGDLRGEEVLVIGDTPLDIECGRAIGAHVLAVATGGHSVTDLKEHRPTWVAESLDALDAAALVT
jgi:phosphoglycolate phosphatase-like HAD superfamily hydrolase